MISSWKTSPIRGPWLKLNFILGFDQDCNVCYGVQKVGFRQVFHLKQRSRTRQQSTFSKCTEGLISFFKFLHLQSSLPETELMDVEEKDDLEEIPAEG